MNLVERIQLERLSRAEQLSRQEQAELLACPEAQALLKENAALAGLEWTAGEDAPSRRLMLARAAVQAGVQQEESKMNLLSRWMASKSLPYKIAVASGIALVVLLTALFIPFERASLLTPAYASSDGYLLTIPLEEQAGMDLETAENAQRAKLEQMLADWRKDYESSMGELPAGFDQSVQVSTSSGDPAAEVALLNADDEQLKSLQKYMEDLPEFPKMSTEPRTWFSEDGAMKPSFSGDGIEIVINGRTFTFPHGVSEAQAEREIRAWLDEAYPEQAMDVDVTIQPLEGGSSVSVNVTSKGSGRVSASASSSSSSSSSGSSESSSSHHHEGSSGGSSYGGGGGGGNAGGGGGGNAGGSGKSGSGSAGGDTGSGSKSGDSGSGSKSGNSGSGSGGGSKSGSANGSGGGSGSGSSHSSNGSSSGQESGSSSENSSSNSSSNSDHNSSSGSAKR